MNSKLVIFIIFLFSVVILFGGDSCDCSKLPSDAQKDADGDPDLNVDGNEGESIDSVNIALARSAQDSGFLPEDWICGWHNMFTTEDNPSPRWREDDPTQYHCISFGIFQTDGFGIPKVYTGIPIKIAFTVLDSTGLFKGIITDGLTLNNTPLVHIESGSWGTGPVFVVDVNGRVIQGVDNRKKLTSANAYLQFCTDPANELCFDAKNMEVYLLSSSTGYRSHLGKLDSDTAGVATFSFANLEVLVNGSRTENDFIYMTTFIHTFGDDKKPDNNDDEWFSLNNNLFFKAPGQQNLILDIEPVSRTNEGFATLDEGFPVTIPEMAVVTQVMRFTYESGNVVKNWEDDRPVTLEVMLSQCNMDEADKISPDQGTIVFSTNINSPDGTTQTLAPTYQTQNTPDYCATDYTMLFEKVPSGQWYYLWVWKSDNPMKSYFNNVYLRVNKSQWIPVTCLVNMTPDSNDPVYNWKFQVGNQQIKQCANNIQDIIVE